MAVQVPTEHLNLAGGFGDEGTEDTDGGRLARPVGTEQGEKIPLCDLQVDAVQGADPTGIGFSQVFDADGQHGLGWYRLAKLWETAS